MRKTVLILGHNDATQFIDIVNQYARLFDKDRYEVTAAYLTGKPNDETRHRTLAENVLFLNLSKRGIRTLKIGAVRNLLALTREKKFEIVICHRYKPSYIMLWVAQFHRIPALVFVMHELHTMSSIGRRLLIAALARKNMVFAGVSNAVRDDLRKDLWNVPKDRIVTLYNVIDIENFSPHLLTRDAARKVLNLPDDVFVFGNIARLVPNKDHKSLIHSFLLITPYCPNAKLMILGDGELNEKLKHQIHAYGLTDQVILAGFVPGAFRYMKAFDVFVLSSIQEAFGRVLIEAMLAKLPVVATRVHGIPEVMGETGQVIAPKHPAIFAEAMKQGYRLSEAVRAQIGEKAYQRVAEHFSLPAFYEQFWHLPLMQSLRE